MTNSNERRDERLNKLIDECIHELEACTPPNTKITVNIVGYALRNGYDAGAEDMREQMQKEIDEFEWLKSVINKYTLPGELDTEDSVVKLLFKYKTALESIHKAYKEHDEPMTRDDMWKIADEALK